MNKANLIIYCHTAHIGVYVNNHDKNLVSYICTMLYSAISTVADGTDIFVADGTNVHPIISHCQQFGIHLMILLM